MRFCSLAVVIVGATMMLASCAQREDEDVTLLEQKSLDAWVAKYITGKGIVAQRQSNGVWVEFIEDGDQTVEAGLDTVVWARLYYTATDIQGNVLATRDSIEALRQRTFTPRTYYTPEYAYVGVENIYGMVEGQYWALRNQLTKPDGTKIKLSTGSHVKLYIPSFLASRTRNYSNDQGYGGQFPLSGSKIVIQDIEVREVIKNPLEHEEKQVVRHATERWGKAETDTLAPGFYIDTINFRPRADLFARFPNKEYERRDSIGLDTTVMVWYIGRFLPTPEYPEGFIFDTNIDIVHDEFYNRRKAQDYTVQSKTLSALSYKPSDNQGSYIAVWYRAIPKLRRGQWGRMVFSSAYGYGAMGMSSALIKQQEYQNQLAQQYMYSSMYSNYGGYGGYGGYGYGYGGYGYGGYGYGYSDFMNYSTSGYSEAEDEQTVTTEIQPYTPLIFEIYIEAKE